LFVRHQHGQPLSCTLPTLQVLRLVGHSGFLNRTTKTKMVRPQEQLQTRLLSAPPLAGCGQAFEVARGACVVLSALIRASLP
jgi:hypothetical protein